MTMQVVRGRTDAVIESIESALNAFQITHPQARIELYRQNSVSVRVRIVEESFRGLSRSQREDTVWEHLNALEREAQNEISMLILVTPDELDDPFAFSSHDFDAPCPSRL